MTVNDADQHEVRAPVRWWHALAAGLLHTGLMLLAFPPVSLYGVAFLAVLPLAWVGWRTSRPVRHGLCVLLGAIPFYAFHMSYIGEITAAGYPPLVVYLSAWPGVFVWLVGVFRRRWPRVPARVMVPVVWVGLDALRGEVIGGGFEWYFVGHPLIGSELLSAPAALGGAYLVTLLVVAVGGIAIDMATGPHGRRVRAGILLAGLSLFWGSSRFMVGDFEAGQAVRLAIVQTNVPQDNKTGWTFESRQRDFAEFLRMTREAALGEPDLIVWPETMFPGFALDDEGAAYLESAGLPRLNEMRTELLAMQAELGIAMLVGATSAENLRVVDDGDRFWFESDATYNSVYVIDGGSVQAERYDKVAPTPFGEMLPYINDWPWLKDMVLRVGLGASGMDFGLDAGREARPLEVDVGGGAIEVATPICFESSMSRVCRRIARGDNGAELMVVMTNDGWFATSDRGREVHLMLARWRCLELGLPLARSANTGISAFVDHRGRVLGRFPAREVGVLTQEVRTGRRATLYGAIGNAVGWLALAGLAGLVVVRAVGAIKDRRTQKRTGLTT